VSSEAARAAATLSVLVGDERIQQMAKAARDSRAGVRTEMVPMEMK